MGSMYEFTSVNLPSDNLLLIAEALTAAGESRCDRVITWRLNPVEIDWDADREWVDGIALRSAGIQVMAAIVQAVPTSEQRAAVVTEPWWKGHHGDDSELVQEIKRWCDEPTVSLQRLSEQYLDELQGTCRNILDTPAYAGDVIVAGFRQAVIRELQLIASSERGQA